MQVHDAHAARQELARGLLDVRERHGAHVAQVLRHDHVRRRRGERREVDVVHRQRIAQQSAHVAIDRAARAGAREDLGNRQHGPADDAPRPVALVRDADESGLEPQGADHLGRRGQEAGDTRRLRGRRALAGAHAGTFTFPRTLAPQGPGGEQPRPGPSTSAPDSTTGASGTRGTSGRQEWHGLRILSPPHR